LDYILYKGDCKKILPKLESESINEIITSPPYFKQREYGNIKGEIGTQGTQEEYVIEITVILKELYRILKHDGLFCFNIDNPIRTNGFLDLSSWDFVPILRNLGFKVICTIIWYDKTRIPITSNKLLKHNYEPIFLLAKSKNYTFNKDKIRVPYSRDKYWGRRDWTPNPEGADRGDVWDIIHFRGNMSNKGDQYDRLGVATFPVQLIDLLIKLGSNKADILLDPFLGSGTTMDVARRLKRSCIGIEINPIYCKSIIKRCFKKDLTEHHIFKYIK